VRGEGCGVEILMGGGVLGKGTMGAVRLDAAKADGACGGFEG